MEMMNVFEYVWVETAEIDSKGEWLKVLKTEGNQLLCERNDPFQKDVYINISEVKGCTLDQIF